MKKSSKYLAAALCLCLALGCLGPTAFADGASISNPGTYTASAMGRNGEVTLTVTYDDSGITAIEAAHDETPTIGGAAIEAMIAQVLAQQTLAPDAVSGATASGDAFLTALSATAEEADASGFAAASAAAEAETYAVTEADVIIVGAGGAGLTAAYTAIEEGASVILVEKSGVVGGNSLCSAQGVNAAGSRTQEELGMEFATADLLKQATANYGGRENLAEAYANASGEAVDWFADELGIEWSGKTSERVDPADPLASVLTGHPGGGDVFMVKATADGNTSTTLVNALDKALKAAGAVVYLNTEATALLTDDSGAVVGVKAVGAGGEEVEFTGKAVLLATGGFGQNHKMVVEYRPDFLNAITDEVAPTTGDGIRMAEAVGAKTVDMAEMQTFPHVVYGDTYMMPPGGMRTPAVFVNQDAQRYATEGFEIGEDTLQQEAAYAIITEDIMNDNLQRLAARGFVVSGETPAELAEALGLDPDALTATVEQWNADCAAGKDSLFANEQLHPLEGTLYGYRFGVGAHYMMGGLLIDENTRVLDENEQPIPGLFAAGEVTGGLHGTVRIDGSGTGDAFVMGHLAGISTAGYALSESEPAAA